MLHTIISGISQLESESENALHSFSSFEYTKIETESELKKAFNSCDVFWFRLNHKITKELVDNTRCKYILCAATGLDHIDIEACKENGIIVISLKDEAEFLKEVRATAEHTIGLLLTLIRKTKNAFQHVEDGNWNRYAFQGFELYKKKVGIYGMGRLGKILADYYYALGMQVYYYDIEEQESHSNFIKTNSPVELCSIVDILSIHLPYNEQTHFIVDESVLKYLKPTSFIVNTARGGVINESDLLKLLLDKKIRGYATDVLYGEPNVKEHPLVEYAQTTESVVITTHIGGNTFESIEKTEFFIVNKAKEIIELG